MVGALVAHTCVPMEPMRRWWLANGWPANWAV